MGMFERVEIIVIEMYKIWIKVKFEKKQIIQKTILILNVYYLKKNP